MVEKWFGFYARAKTFENIVALASAAINAAGKEKSVIFSLAIRAMLSVGGTAAQVADDPKSAVWCVRNGLPAIRRVVTSAETATTVDANDLQTLPVYNAEGESLQVIELFIESLAGYDRLLLIFGSVIDQAQPGHNLAQVVKRTTQPAAAQTPPRRPPRHRPVPERCRQ